MEKNIYEYKKELFQMVCNSQYKIYIKRVGIFYFSESYSHIHHFHEEVEVNCVIGGSCVMEVEGTVVNLKQGDSFVIFPGKKHNFLMDIGNSCRMTQVIFKLELPEQIPNDLLFLKKLHEGICPFIKIKHLQELPNIIKQINLLYKHSDGDLLKETQMELCFLQLYFELSIGIYNEKTLDSKTFENKFGQVLQYIHENINLNLNMEKIAFTFEISSRYLRHKFIIETGVNGLSYIRTLRLSLAKRKLKETVDSITEIAIDCGFSSSQNFSRVFRKEIGITPSQYRKQENMKTNGIIEH